MGTIQNWNSSTNGYGLTAKTLHAVSPLATLNRGYALVIHQPSGQIIRSTAQLKAGDKVETRLAEGRFTSQIEATIQK